MDRLVLTGSRGTLARPGVCHFQFERRLVELPFGHSDRPRFGPRDDGGGLQPELVFGVFDRARGSRLAALHSAPRTL